jgi:hypothetical protein
LALGQRLEDPGIDSFQVRTGQLVQISSRSVCPVKSELSHII